MIYKTKNNNITLSTKNKAALAGLGCVTVITALLYLLFWGFIGVSIIYAISHFLFHWI